MDILLILAIALAIDLVLGEPPRIIHPVVWMGKVISFLETRGVGRHPLAQFIYGIVITLLIIGLFTVPAYFILLYLKSLAPVAHVVVGAVFLKSTFSLKELRRVALKVKSFLLKEKLDEARFELRSLVSRDTRGLPQPLLVSATVESVAESTGDSFVAPLFYFLLFGVPGAIAYRVVNTMDAMLGYHGKYEYLGKFVTRLDDVLNFIPARLSALLLVSAAFLSRRDARSSWQTALNSHSRTESPNAGWPIAAVAGALNVRLEKRGHYRLGKAGVLLIPETIDDSLKLMQIAVLGWALICFIVGVVYFVYTI
ncbi:MAG: cobalamin biosynthesis protein CobD [Dehalococcoidales bacterium]|nr:cobalamin biosynthesis protein CobD [Dehalococcoidales bacterium]